MTAVQGIGLAAVAVASSGCGLPDVPYTGTTRDMFIYEDGSREFSVFVYPRTAPRDVAIQAALKKAHNHCLAEFGTGKVELISLTDGTFAVPTEWDIRGRCA